MANLRLVRIIIPLIALVVASAATDAVAGACREALRPLLLQTPPDQAALRDARKLCAAESEAGDADALYQSSLFHLGLLDWDVDAAIPMIQTAAREGVPEAQYWLAWQYEEGPLLPNDTELALQWYGLAGDNEHRLALDRLAGAYQNGELGLQANHRKAAEMRARAERCKDEKG